MTEATPKPPRSWSTFSLRTMFVAVMLFAAMLGWVMWQRQIVRDRWAMRSWLQSQDAWVVSDLVRAELSIRGTQHQTRRPREMLAAIRRRQNVRKSLPIVRRWFGDEFIEGIYLADVLSGQRAEIERLFSEAAIIFESDALRDELEERDRQVQNAISSPTNLEFENAELQDVVAYLADLHNVHIRLDSMALEKAQIDPASLLTFHRQTDSLREALVQLLTPLSLTFSVGQGEITISTKSGRD